MKAHEAAREVQGYINDIAHNNPEAFDAIRNIVHAHNTGNAIVAVELWTMEDVKRSLERADIEDYIDEDLDIILGALDESRNFNGAWSPDEFDDVIWNAWDEINESKGE